METHLVLSESTEDDEGNPTKNPFKVPSDAELFSMRDKEIKKAQEEYEKRKTMKVHEKATYSTRMKEKSGLRKALKREEEKEGRKEATCEERLKVLQELLSRKLAMKKDYALDRETFHGYLQDRKQIFYLEYAIAVKRGEIEKMETIAKNEEKKLEKAERRMEKDAAVFDEFLKENHNYSVEALRIARRETSAKTKKVTEIHGITTQIKKIQSEISRFEDTLQEYMMYRDILYQLSPREWQEEHRKRRRKGKDVKTEPRAKGGGASDPPTAEQDQDPAARTSTAPSLSFTDLPSSLMATEGLNFRARDINPQLKQFLKPLLARELSSLEDAESETSSDEDEEPELYFTHPEQLLITFTEMLDENLSFVLNSQDIAESWHKVQQTFITTRDSLEKELAELKEQVNTLRDSVAKEEEKVADLKRKVQRFSSGEQEGDEQDKMLTSLNKKVLEVYSNCTGDHETNLPTVEMLKVIEKKLNDLLDSVERIPPAKIEKAVKIIRREQRARLREEKQKQARQQQQDEGLKRDMERSQVPEEKKGYKTMALPSNPPARKNSQGNR
ncbi:cilia- and flagella-associated protein 100-like [Oenanthe melanoleuca]|uniref:cilia- and flagella-associated protein 100-like n=1 Tax=Oenanthe melanoleuca TaxID=2939378 RepID=UPI0024C1EB9E|nr:cilia- and flagella-associated protein 100-like [Oenanthe melanoleuca]XP_056372118.1 cilia- and flagella-associated protein 100-like [Oenanthe melanoleuca]XP_056372119.1 cilia- and flagella-associated protein 100-like [Oenanthe melanoleuca]